MADVEEPKFTTLAERIAALNRQKNFQSPPSGGKRPPPPPPPNRPTPKTQTGSMSDAGPAPTVLQRSPTVPPRQPARERDSAPPLPHRSTAEEQATTQVQPQLPSRNLAPPLPTRWPSQASQSSQSDLPVSPALPPRRSSTQPLHARRNSNESDISYVSTVSTLSLNQTTSNTDHQQPQAPRRLPPTLDQANLPPLPPTRRELEAKAKEAAATNGVSHLGNNKTASRIISPALRGKPTISEPPPLSRPSLPPRLPSRPNRSPAAEPVQNSAAQSPELPARRLPPPPASYVRSNSTTATKPTVVAELETDVDHDVPPPVPLSSRPTNQQIDAAVTLGAAPQAINCLVCRDFSAPDAVAAQYPVHSLPRHDIASYLARVLCDPFPSPTDKARAIFTWCHHNISYDAESFFGGCIPRGLTTDQTILSGKAVCEGYAKVYQAVAQQAGLECVIISGHGKGFGFKPVKAGEPAPPRKATGHAWNAVRLDDGRWKLLDACWGAGHLGEGNRYYQAFDPIMFTQPNELFGMRHFPADARHFYRADGSSPTWEEYVVGPQKGEPAQWYGGHKEEGLSEYGFSPAAKHIPVHSGDNELLRFQFSKVCEHWDTEKHGNGKPRLLLLKIHGVDGRMEDITPLDHDAFWWWIDVPRRELGAPGQTISLFALDTLDGKDARGVTKEEFLRQKGRVGMSWVGIAAWELVRAPR